MLIGLFSHYFFGISIFVTSVFLVLLVLVQRGRGGGLVGALGGPGGQSALGTKAGDVFTRITIVVAAIWIFLCASAVRVLNPSGSNPLSGLDEYSEVSAAGGDKAPPATTGGAGAIPATPLPGVTPATPAASPATPATGTSSPAIGQPATGSPATGSPATSQPATQSPATGSPATGSPATDQPATGSPDAPASSTSTEPAASSPE